MPRLSPAQYSLSVESWSKTPFISFHFFLLLLWMLVPHNTITSDIFMLLLVSLFIHASCSVIKSCYFYDLLPLTENLSGHIALFSAPCHHHHIYFCTLHFNIFILLTQGFQNWNFGISEKKRYAWRMAFKFWSKWII